MEFIACFGLISALFICLQLFFFYSCALYFEIKVESFKVATG